MVGTKLKYIAAPCFVFLLAIFLPLVASAQGLKDAFGTILSDTATDAGYKPKVSLTDLAGDIITLILTLLGTIFMIMIIYSGLRWMTAGGNEQAIDRAKGTIKQALIGLIIVIGAYALSRFFILIFA